MSALRGKKPTTVVKANDGSTPNIARDTHERQHLPLRGPSIEGACCRWLRRAGRRQESIECTVRVGVVVRRRCVKIDLQLVVSQGNARMYANVLVLTRYETGCLTHKQRASIDDLHTVKSAAIRPTPTCTLTRPAECGKFCTVQHGRSCSAVDLAVERRPPRTSLGSLTDLTSAHLPP